MDIIFFGRNFWLIDASEYRLLTKYINYFEIKDSKLNFSFILEQNYVIETEKLYYGLTYIQEGLPNTYPVRLFWKWKTQFYPIDRAERECVSCHQNYVGYSVRSRDLYQGTEDIARAYEWGRSLPYITGCPKCGFKEDNDQRFLAILFNGNIITNL